LGDDLYVIHSVDQGVAEFGGTDQGVDTVSTTLDNYQLGSSVENLIYTGAGNFFGKGNGSANQITGGAGNDTLYGTSGHDTLDGGDGTDTALYSGVRAAYAISLTGSTFTIIDGRPGSSDGADNVTNVEYFQFSDGTVSAGNLLNVPGVTITGTTNADLIDATHTISGQPLPTSEGDTISGGKGNDSIDALGGNDSVTGDAGNDSLLGGAGNDSIAGGIGNDTLFGGDGDDTLDDGPGADPLSGGLGNDVYIVDKPTDIVTENPGEGTDTVKTGLGSYVLGSNLENLIYTGAANFKGTGNALDNLIIGSAGSDTLTGGAGADTVTGGAGADHFLFKPGDLATGPVFDEVTDFSHAEGDRISLSAIDANSNTLANESFVFIGAGAFTHAARQLHYVVNSSGGVNVEGDTNGDGVADFHIVVDGVNSLVAADFIL
jgi:serralysin